MTALVRLRSAATWTQARDLALPAAAADGRQLHRDQPRPGQGGAARSWAGFENVLRLPLAAGRASATREALRAALQRAGVSRCLTWTTGTARAGCADLEPHRAICHRRAAGRGSRRRASAFEALKDGLNAASVRAAERGPDGSLAGQCLGQAGHPAGVPARADRPAATGGPFPFFDKDTYPLRAISSDDGVRIVPGGSAIRDGCYVGRGVVCMPPMYINVGAYVDDGTMVDSHALVGSCAQIGRRVHLSAGGPDRRRAGAGGRAAGDYRGRCAGGRQLRRVRGHDRPGARGAGPGDDPDRRYRVVDLVHDRVYRRDGDRPLEIPPGAVVVPGSRPVRSGIRQGLGHEPLRPCDCEVSG